MKSYIAYILLMVACLVVACSESKDEPTPQTQPQTQPASQTTPTTPTPATGSVWSDVPIGFSAVVEDHATTRTALTPVYGPDLTNDAFYTGTGEGRHIVWGSVTYNPNVTATTLNGNTNEDGKGFGVYSVYTGNDTYADAITAAQAAVSGLDEDKRSERQLVMFNQQVTTTDNGVSWDYTPKRFWPGNAANISFFAYAPYKVAGIDYPVSSNIDNTKTTEVFSYVKKEDFGVPYINWDHETQQDLLYGVANEDVIDYTMAPFKLAGDDYVDMHRPNDNALHWKLKHALARAKFTISNYMSYEDQLASEAVAIGGSDSKYKKYLSGGTYKINPADVQEQPKDLAGYYVHMGNDEPHIWYKYGSETTRKVFITSITINNMYKQGNLYLRNDANNRPLWDNCDRYVDPNPYQLLPVNPAVFKNVINEGDLTPDDFNSLTNVLGKNAVPLNVALSNETTVDESKEHYVLFIPQYYDEGATNNIEITIKYQVFSYVKLEAKFSWASDVPTCLGAVTEIPDEYYKACKEQTLKGVLPISLEANKTYNIGIQLGKLMNILFEITDWDDMHTVYLPDFY